MFRAPLFTVRQKGKISHDKLARHLSFLELGHTVWMETTCRFNKLVMVSGKVCQPNSHIIQSNSKTYQGTAVTFYG